MASSPGTWIIEQYPVPIDNKKKQLEFVSTVTTPTPAFTANLFTANGKKPHKFPDKVVLAKSEKQQRVYIKKKQDV